MSLSERRNIRVKFIFEEGSSEYVPFSCPTSDEGTPPPSPPCAKRQRVDLDEEEEFEASGDGEDEASGDEASGDEASGDEASGDGEEEGGASAPWSGVREKYLQYDVAYV